MGKGPGPNNSGGCQPSYTADRSVDRPGPKELPPQNKKNPYCYMDIDVGGSKAGRFIFELFKGTVPRTVENFIAYCAGDRGPSPVTGKQCTYVGACFHRVIEDFMIQGGDTQMGDGTGSESIYGRTFPDESFVLRHSEPGVLSMANSGPDSNGNQFFITLRPVPHLDGRHVVFGRLVDGFALLNRIGSLKTGANDVPILPVVITASGECGPPDSDDEEDEVVPIKKRAAPEPKKDDEELQIWFSAPGLRLLEHQSGLFDWAESVKSVAEGVAMAMQAKKKSKPAEVAPVKGMFAGLPGLSDDDEGSDEEEEA